MLLGSTEWAEFHEKELNQHAVAYINSDGNGRGFVQLNGSQTLEHFANEAVRDVIDPAKKVSALDRYRAALIVGGSPEQKQNARAKHDIELRRARQRVGFLNVSGSFGDRDARHLVRRRRRERRRVSFDLRFLRSLHEVRRSGFPLLDGAVGIGRADHDAVGGCGDDPRAV